MAMTQSQLLDVLNAYIVYFGKDVDEVEFGDFVYEMELYTKDNTEYDSFEEVPFEEAMAWFA